MKRISSLEKSRNEKYVHIPGCQKNGAFHIGIQKNRAIHILFVEKRGPIIYLAALKKGAIRLAHPYYAIYRKLPPPPPAPHPHPHPSAHPCSPWVSLLAKEVLSYFSRKQIMRLAIRNHRRTCLHYIQIFSSSAITPCEINKFLTRLHVLFLICLYISSMLYLRYLST